MARNLPTTNPNDPVHFEGRDYTAPYVPGTPFEEPPYKANFQPRREPMENRLRDFVGVENGKVHPSTRGPGIPWPAAQAPARKPFKL